MLSIAAVFIVSATALFVYLDATSNRIGKVPGAGGLFNMSAGGWAVATLLIWLVAFPAYLIKRRALISQAAKCPIEPRRRMVKAAAIGLAGTAWVALAAIPYLEGSLPRCDSADVVALAEKIVRDALLVKMTGLEVKRLSFPVEQGYDRAAEARVCRGVLAHSQGEEQIQYSVEWHDQSKGLIWVRILPL
jgi:hypothetical protein